MDKVIIFICLFTILFNTPVKSINIDCVYHAGDFSHSVKGASNYWCRVNNLNLISRQDLIVENITGTHLSGKSDDNLRAFQVYTGTAYYFLKGVEKYFKNIIGLGYQNCHLKEIHREDLKPFPNIVDLYLNNNDLEVIEEGLFDFNPELILIYLISNKITQIHSNVFDHLGKLTHLYLSSNTCINKDTTDATASRAFITQIRTDYLCQNIEFINIEGSLKMLENYIKPMNSSTFKSQLQKLKTEFKYSKYSKFSPFDDRIENLKIVTYAEHCKTSNQTELIDEFYDSRPPRLEDFSDVGDKIKVMDETLGDFQMKIDALSSKVTKIADIVEQLEDKLGKIFKNVNIKVVVDV